MCLHPRLSIRGPMQLTRLSLKISSFIVFLFSLSLYANEKVAVIINGSDVNLGNLAPHFDKSAAATADLYSKNGYRIVKIEASLKMGAHEFRQSLNELKNVDEVALIFLTHGTVIDKGDSLSKDEPFSKSDLTRFPLSYLREDELAIDVTGDGSRLSSPLRFSFAMVQPNPNQDITSKWIGVGDLHRSLSTLKLANPKVKVNLTIMSCFGSNTTRSLLDIPDVQVFTGGAASQMSDVVASKNTEIEKVKNSWTSKRWMLNELEKSDYDISDSIDFTQNFTKELELGRAYLDAFSKGRALYLSEKQSFLLSGMMTYSTEEKFHQFLVRPQSSLELIASDECLGHPPNEEITPFCHDYQNGLTIEDMISPLSRIPIVNYLTRELDLDTLYLNRVEDFLICNKSESQKISKNIKKLLIKARKELETILDSITQRDFDRAARKYEEQITNTRNSKTIQDLVSIVYDDFQLGVFLTSLKDGPEQSDEARKKRFNDAKEGILGLLEMRRMAMKSPIALKMTRVMYNQHLADMDHKSPTYAACLNDPLHCNIEHAFQWFTFLTPPIPVRHYHTESIQLLLERCPAMQSRLALFQCLDEVTKGSDLLKVHAYVNANFNMPDNERRKSCDLISKEKRRNDTLKACLHSPEYGSGRFWSKMNSLYVQGMTTLVKK